MYSDAWEKILEDSKNSWGVEFDLSSLESTAKIAWNPKELIRTPIGKYLIQITCPKIAWKQDFQTTRENLEKKIPSPDLKHMAENKLMDDPINPELIVVANKFPKQYYQALLLTKQVVPQVEKGSYLKSQFYWASQNAIVEFHRQQEYINHYHAHLYTKEHVPIVNFFNKFKKKYEAKNIEWGQLENYPIPHLAITSRDEEGLRKIILMTHERIEGLEMFLNHDIFKTGDYFTVLFFIQKNYSFTEGFDINTLGIINTGGKNWSEEETVTEISKKFISQKESDALCLELFNGF